AAINKNWQQATLDDIATFLTSTVDKDTISRPQATINNAISALRLLYFNAPDNPTTHHIIDRLRKGLINKFTSRIRAPTNPLPIRTITIFIKKSWPLNSRLDGETLRNKAMALLTITLMLRPSQIALLNVNNVKLSSSGDLIISELGFKTDKSKEGSTRTIAP